MNNIQRLTKSRIILFMLSCLLPLAIFSLGVIFLLKGMIINVNFLIIFLILPLSYSAGCYFLIFSKCKVYLKIILFVSLLGLTLFLLLYSFLFGNHERIQHHTGANAIEHYAEGYLHEQTFPVIPEIGESEHVEFHEYDCLLAIFTSEADTLICQYSDDDYWKQKDLLKDKFTFLEESITIRDRTCMPATQIDGYSFRMLAESDKKEWDMQFPKSIALIATNDATHEIVYIAFYDQDLDYIESLTDFINEDCGWEHIR